MSIFTPHRKLTVGLIYETDSGDLVRLIRDGGAGWFSARGCTKKTATPFNRFLASEMENDMASKTNRFQL